MYNKAYEMARLLCHETGKYYAVVKQAIPAGGIEYHALQLQVAMSMVGSSGGKSTLEHVVIKP